MTRPVTCYERDEAPCTDMRCKFDGCRLAKQPVGVAQGQQEPVGYTAYHPTYGWRLDLAAKNERIATAVAMRSIDGAAQQGWEIRPLYAAQPPAASAQGVRDYIPLPRKLTAENGAKAALIGEFSETFHYMDDEGDECTAEIPVSWDTIKSIWDTAVAHFLAAQPPAAPVETDDLVEVVIACCNGQMGRDAAIEVISELRLAGFEIVPVASRGRSSAETSDGWKASEDTNGPNGCGYYTAGIDIPIVGEARPRLHYAAIEFHAKDKAVAEQRRDAVLKALHGEPQRLGTNQEDGQ